MQPTFAAELESLINRHSIENESDTPDFILAQYIRGCLDAWNCSVRDRDKWYGFKTLNSPRIPSELPADFSVSGDTLPVPTVGNVSAATQTFSLDLKNPKDE